MKFYILSLIFQLAPLYHLDPNLVMSVVETESNFNVNALGAAGEIGLLQVMPQYVKGISKEELAKPVVNLTVGMAILEDLQKTCVHKKNDTYLLCYNLGREKAKVIKHPTLYPYYKKIKGIMARNNGVLYE